MSKSGSASDINDSDNGSEAEGGFQSVLDDRKMQPFLRASVKERYEQLKQANMEAGPHTQNLIMNGGRQTREPGTSFGLGNRSQFTVDSPKGDSSLYQDSSVVKQGTFRASKQLGKSEVVSANLDYKDGLESHASKDDDSMGRSPSNRFVSRDLTNEHTSNEFDFN